MQADEQYASALVRIRKMRRRLFLAVPPWFIGFGALAFVTVATQNPVIGVLTFAEGLGGAVLILVGWIRLLLARCPRCRRTYFSRWNNSLGVLGSRCVHCGLALPRPGPR